MLVKLAGSVEGYGWGWGHLGIMHDPDLHGAGKATRGECGRDAEKRGPEYAPACILTVNQRLLSAISRHKLDPISQHSERPLSEANRKFDSATLRTSLTVKNGQYRPFTLTRNSNTRMSAFSSKAAVKEGRFRLSLDVCFRL